MSFIERLAPLRAQPGTRLREGHEPPTTLVPQPERERRHAVEDRVLVVRTLFRRLWLTAWPLSRAAIPSAC